MDIFQWLPESARFLMTSSRPEEAYETLKRVAEQNGRPMPSGKLVESVNTDVGTVCCLGDGFLFSFWRAIFLERTSAW